MTRNNNRFISGAEIGAVASWEFSAVDQASTRFKAKLLAQEQAEEMAKSESIRQAGFSEGFADGFAQGHAKGTLEVQRRLDEYVASQGAEAAKGFANLFAAAQNQIDASEQEMAKGVIELACSLARQVLRHELATNPNALQPVIREALGMLAADHKIAIVRLNPQDMEVLAEVLRQEFSFLSLTLVSDSTILRGGCLVESTGTIVDGTVEKRWLRSVASLGVESAWDIQDHGY